MKRKNDNFRKFVNNVLMACSKITLGSKMSCAIRLCYSVGFIELNDFLKKNEAYDEFWEKVNSYHDLIFHDYHLLARRLVAYPTHFTVGEFLRGIDYSFNFALNEPKDKEFTWENLLLNQNNEFLGTTI